MTIADQVRRLTAQHLGIEADRVTDEARFREDLGADSLDAFDLLMTFEDAFGIEIPDDDADPMQRVRDAVTYVEVRVAAGRQDGGSCSGPSTRQRPSVKAQGRA